MAAFCDAYFDSTSAICHSCGTNPCKEGCINMALGYANFALKHVTLSSIHCQMGQTFVFYSFYFLFLGKLGQTFVDDV